MVPTYSFRLFQVLSLLGLLPLVFAHGHDSNTGDSVGMAMSEGTSHMASVSNINMNSTTPVLPSYFSHSDFSGLMLAHIISMTIAWFFILPIGEFMVQRLE